ncbi:MAG TPA: hypothetical protein VEG40_07595 [Gaiellaceae bacterium]|nr:hypothetical protein [Gaiellaceae bacterium]
MRKRPAAHITVLIAVTAGLTLALFLPGRAAAATPCWKKVLNDWSKGRAIGVYPLHCYRDAIKNLPEDLRDYSSAADDINAALQAQIAHRENRTPQGINPSPGAGGGGNSTGGGEGGGGKPSAAGGDPSPSAYRRAIDNLGTSNADAVPLPLIVLASFGALLLVLAAALTVTKRLRALRARRR